MTFQQIALALAWIAMAFTIIWRVRSAIRGTSGTDTTIYISFYSIFFVVPLVIILVGFGFTPTGLYVGIPAFLILLFLCQQGFRFWMKLWRQGSH